MIRTEVLFGHVDAEDIAAYIAEGWRVETVQWSDTAGEALCVVLRMPPPLSVEVSSDLRPSELAAAFALGAR